jgi:3-isopropylmalate/(R)-2-methylmalate dehydratase large subunit
MGQTLIDKIWNVHRVAKRADGRELIYIDRHVLHDLHAAHGFANLERAQRTVRRPDLTISVPDHTIATRPVIGAASRPGSSFADGMRRGSSRFGITMLDLNDSRQGIVHVVSPELGIALPGLTLACPDSHASTVGAIGTLAFACGTSELEHVLATQVIAIHKPKSFLIKLDGTLGQGVTAKDVALKLISVIGVAAGRGFAVEYAGSAVRAMDIDGRLALCNLTSEFGGRTAIIAPDDVTFSWCHGRDYAPKDAAWDSALAWWRTLSSDQDAGFDETVTIDCSDLEPQITWGTDPGQVISVTAAVPDPTTFSGAQRAAANRALSYMALEPGRQLAGVRIDRVFIGSCANGRLSDLRAVADFVRGRQIAPGVKAIAVPGSTRIKHEAEREGIAATLRDAGFEWHESGCSMCAGVNGDIAQPGERCVSTTNRNFENRQGAGVRTHLASPLTAAAAALAGTIVDPRRLKGP